ncbi:MAG: hypothetical protein NC191_09280 [Muribaculaceae bacterium]|nr:hypothetical protein [Muribaculaceae bacterium]
MKILEIKNNLVKLAYSESEMPVLGRFIVLTAEAKSYVAQFVNLKSDNVNSYAIAKLLFTFTPDGVVDNYDGSVPDINSQISFLPSSELLNLLPIETPVEIGVLAQQDDVLKLDVSVFERNFTVFVEKDANKTAFISNCVRQLFRMKEKCVVIDNCNLFEDYPKIHLAEDFKLPLNSEMMDYIFEYDLAEVDVPTKAVIQDIFYEVQKYIRTLDGGFLPIEKFVEAVASQYQSTQMPELALLKNKLLKYRDAGIFADTADEIEALKQKLDAKNCIIVDTKDINEPLQKEVIRFVHGALETFDNFSYFFVPLTDENSDKNLLNSLINHNRVFTTLLARPHYKYVKELKEHAQNIILFSPSTLSNDFTTYNTFLGKLNTDECIVEGKLTQGIPFIVSMDDLDVDLTKEDVFGGRVQFIPAQLEGNLVKVDEFGEQTVIDDAPPSMVETVEPLNETLDMPIEPTSSLIVSEPVIEETSIVDADSASVSTAVNNETPEIIEPVSNIMADDNLVDFQDVTQQEVLPQDDVVDEVYEDLSLPMEDDELISEEDDGLDFEDDSLSEEDLNFIEESQTLPEEDFGEYEESPYVEEQPPVVPVYPADEDASVLSVGEFAQGDSVTHPRYGRGVVEKIIKYGNKTLCSISFENVGRRLLDPTISELTKLG